MTEATPVTPAPRAGGMLAPALLGALFALLALSPLGYGLYRHIPPRVVTVDLQAIVEEQQKSLFDSLSKGGELSADQRATVEKSTVDFAKKLSAAVDTLGEECHCVIINKAALLGGETVDYTDYVRERLKK